MEKRKKKKEKRSSQTLVVEVSNTTKTNAKYLICAKK
jgi:hypothetical protein